jgi:hypothetical protein
VYKKPQTVYVKKGRRYQAVGEYSPEFTDNWPEGYHLVICKPGSRLTRYGIDPDWATVQAVAENMVSEISNKIYLASQLKDGNLRRLTAEQKQLLDQFIASLGGGGHSLSWPSSAEIARFIVEHLVEQTRLTLKTPATAKAWERYRTLVALENCNEQN